MCGFLNNLIFLPIEGDFWLLSPKIVKYNSYFAFEIDRVIFFVCNFVDSLL